MSYPGYPEAVLVKEKMPTKPTSQRSKTRLPGFQGLPSLSNANPDDGARQQNHLARDQESKHLQVESQKKMQLYTATPASWQHLLAGCAVSASTALRLAWSMQSLDKGNQATPFDVSSCPKSWCIAIITSCSTWSKPTKREPVALCWTQHTGRGSHITSKCAPCKVHMVLQKGQNLRSRSTTGMLCMPCSERDKLHAQFRRNARAFTHMRPIKQPVAAAENASAMLFPTRAPRTGTVPRLKQF